MLSNQRNKPSYSTFNTEIDLKLYATAHAGDAEGVNTLILNGGNLDAAFQGYASGGHTHLVEALTKETHQRFFENIRKGYRDSGQLHNKDQLLKILATTDDLILRRTLARCDIVPDVDIHYDDATEVLLEKAVKLNKVMNIYNFTFEQAQELQNAIQRIDVQYQQSYLSTLFYGQRIGERCAAIFDVIRDIRARDNPRVNLVTPK